MAATSIFGCMNDATFFALADQLSDLQTQAQHAALRQVNSPAKTKLGPYAVVQQNLYE
jgi:hypothetical protein